MYQRRKKNLWILWMQGCLLMCASVLDIVYNWTLGFLFLPKEIIWFGGNLLSFLHFGLQLYSNVNHSTNHRAAMQSDHSKFLTISTKFDKSFQNESQKLHWKLVSLQNFSNIFFLKIKKPLTKFLLRHRFF